ncbi:MAG: hypothetical protein V3V52_02035 [Candidatus Adiutricales bacterium]
MIGKARVVVSDFPDHITLRGNKRKQVFCKGQGCQIYLEFMAQFCCEARKIYWSKPPLLEMGGQARPVP